jgi:hypothetical protein
MLDPSSYRCSSPSPAKHSPPNSGPLKRPASGRFCASGLGARKPERYGNSLSEHLSLSEAWGLADLLYKFLLSVFNVNRFTNGREVAVSYAPANSPANRPLHRSRPLIKHPKAKRDGSEDAERAALTPSMALRDPLRGSTVSIAQPDLIKVHL